MSACMCVCVCMGVGGVHQNSTSDFMDFCGGVTQGTKYLILLAGLWDNHLRCCLYVWYIAGA